MKKIAPLITAAFMAGAAPQVLAADAPWLADFKKADLNDSSGLSLAELDKSKSSLLKPLKNNFKAIDANDDGHVTAAEYERYLDKADDAFEAQFKKADLNDSGGLSRKELEKASGKEFDLIEKNFDAIDADKDGQVSIAEYKKHQSTQAKTVPVPAKDGCTPKCGVVIEVDRYKQDGEGGVTGMVAGGVAGGVVGNQAVGGTLGTLGGAAAGAFAGNEIQKRMNTKKMVKVTVRFDDGTQRDYDFEGEKSEFKRGERVLVREGHLKHFKGN